MADNVFGKKREYDVIREGQEQVLRIDSEDWSNIPSIEDDPGCMSKIIGYLMEVPSASRIIFMQKRNYNYNYKQTQILLEIANIYNHLVRQSSIFSFNAMGSSLTCNKCYPVRFGDMKYITLTLMRSDPLGAYVELKRLRREENILMESETNEECKRCRKHYMTLVDNLIGLLERTSLIRLNKDKLAGYSLGDRSLYKEIFRPLITPNFMFTRLMADHPINGEIVDSYKVGDSDITIYKIPNEVKLLYHMTPPEFKVSEDSYELLDMARTVLAEHEPKAEEFIDPERIRHTFFNIGRDLLQDLVKHTNYNINYDDIEELARILVRYTIGFGLIELLLKDKKIQDIVVNGPIGVNPIYIVHEDYGECVTNVLPSREDGISWATKFRIISGRPLDEANPVLDTELLVPGARARVAIIGSPLNPWGLGYAFRRHRDKPWTLPLFVNNNMISGLGAGLMSFLVDGSRTILVAGTRSSGKTSFLSSIMVEIMRKYRIVSLEDTLELPTEDLRKLGYNIQPMKVQAVVTKGTTEVPADEGIRISLRLGDSSLIVGEVRSLEAKALYEAMRVGALANVVAGTIHGDSPYGVFDRVVNDLQVPRTSFKATDIIVICSPVRSADGLHSWKRVTQITEVRKEWEDDPLRENGFVDLMTYNSKTDKLEPTADLMNGDSDVLKSIAGKIKDWTGNWDAMWDNIMLRTKMKEALVKFANKDKDLLEADFVVKANDQFHIISESVKNDIGNLDSKRIYFEWEDWLKKELKRRK